MTTTYNIAQRKMFQCLISYPSIGLNGKRSMNKLRTVTMTIICNTIDGYSILPMNPARIIRYKTRETKKLILPHFLMSL
jgi:hypothetical protein